MRKIILFAVATLPFLALTISAGSLSAPKTSDDDSVRVQKAEQVIPESSIVDEVIWVVGDEPILKSEVEALRQYYEEERIPIKGDPYCYIPEQIAMQKLFLHQAAIDSIEVTESDIAQRVDAQLDHWIQSVGSQEKLEEYQRKSIAQIRRGLHDDIKNSMIMQQMRLKLVQDVSVTPSDVRRYFENVPADSVPFVPTEVEVEIITQQPRIAIEEINRIKDRLREFTDRVNKGETTFATLARLYSEDGSARNGGELGYMGRGTLDPAFANVAFNLTDPKKVSKIVESEYGYHIIQLIDKRGDRINCRHILLKPQVSGEAVEQMKARLDSLATDIRGGLLTFEAGAVLSDDKDTRNNHGLMSYVDQEAQTITSRFNMKDLPTEVARVVDTLQVGQISQAFTMINSRGKLTTAIVKLVNRIDAHRATITEDFQVLKNIVLAKRREEVINEWLADKIKRTY
ncbi:MAG: peptidylprolyl isomerase, partial [Prevotella sp.]|nr:peptidylprolyl isomerase [Prevotella sp.]